MGATVLNPDPAPGTVERSPVELAAALLAAARSNDEDERDRLAAALHGVDPSTFADDATRIAFWLNLYNALLLHELGERPRSGSVLRQPRLFSKTAYRVGDHAYSLDQIEHGVLRANRRPPYGIRAPFRDDDPRLAAAVSKVDPRIHFALNCGARSCPSVHVYDAEGLAEELKRATRSYVTAETRIDREGGKVELPALIKIYGADFGSDADRLKLVAKYLPKPDGKWLWTNSEEISVGYSDYDWRIETEAA